MKPFLDSFVLWLGDCYLLTSALLALALAGSFFLTQPAQRLAVAKSTILGLLLLAALGILPGWSMVHLVSKQPQPRLEDHAAAQLTAVEYSVPSTQYKVPNVSPARKLDPSPPAPAAHQTASTRAWPQISWPAVLTLAYALGAACFFAWLAAGSLAAHRLRCATKPAHAELARLFTEMVHREEASGSRPELLVSDRIDVAVALGLWRPAVLLPEHWTRSQSPGQLRSVLAHELAHVRNHDLRWLAASRALLVLLWAQPFYWLLRCRMRLDQEALADAAAAEVTGRQHYAEQLVAWARNIAPLPTTRLYSAVGLWEGPSQLRRRIAVLLDERLNFVRECSRQYRITSLVVFASAALLLSLVTLDGGRAEGHPETGFATSRSDDAADDEVASGKAAVENEPRHFVRIVSGPKGALTFEGERTTWDDLPGVLEKVGHRSETVLEFAIATDDISVREMEQARRRAMSYAQRFDFRYASYIGVQPLGSNGSAPARSMPALLSYGDGKADGKWSYGGSGHIIRFELPAGVTKVRGLRIHGSRYGLPQAPDEDFEIAFLSEDLDEILHSEAAPYHLFKRGREQWVRVLFDKEVELPEKFWVALNFDPHQTKGVYVSYDTKTNGEYSRVGLPGDDHEPKKTDFGGDWMVQVMLPRPER